MDAVKFIEEAKRMCNANISNCAECCKGRACPINLPGANYTPEERVKIVEEWAAAHPRKTRQSVFLEQWPNARPADDGVLTFCPKRFDFHISCLAECHSLKSAVIAAASSGCRRWSDG